MSLESSPETHLWSSGTRMSCRFSSQRLVPCLTCSLFARLWMVFVPRPVSRVRWRMCLLVTTPTPSAHCCLLCRRQIVCDSTLYFWQSSTSTSCSFLESAPQLLMESIQALVWLCRPEYIILSSPYNWVVSQSEFASEEAEKEEKDALQSSPEGEARQSLKSSLAASTDEIAEHVSDVQSFSVRIRIKIVVLFFRFFLLLLFILLFLLLLVPFFVVSSGSSPPPHS